MNLKTYLEKHPRGEAARLARAIGCHETRITEYKNGKRSPGIERALLIERLTGRQVKAADLIATKK